MPKTRSENIRRINLALQGGGSHGAFTWGVLDRLLEEESLHIEGISGTSAGAMNGAILAQGHAKNGADGAKTALETFWRRISDYSPFSPVRSSFLDRMTGNWNLDASPTHFWYETMTALLSPYQLNPLNFNPLRTILEDSIDLPTLRSGDCIKLYVSATNVETGKIRIFERDELSVDALLASACLPTVFQAVIIDGEPYWDGGYMGNPAIFPLIYGCESPDVVIIEVNPLTRKGTPVTASDIMNRLNEITFNSSLMREMRAIAFASRLKEATDGEHPEIQRLKKMNMHMIEMAAEMAALGSSSKLNTSWDFLTFLKARGREQAEIWLRDNLRAVGKHSTVDFGRFL
jgi:NTE family protein